MSMQIFRPFELKSWREPWIGHQNVKVAMIGWLLFCSYFLSIYCLFISFG